MIPIILILIQSIFINPTIYSSSQPEELGKVNWLRNFDQGINKAATEQKPVFLLFQEVPGCSTCRNYGHNVLSHPLIVEAIEELFIPVAIFNNKGGEDAKVLKMYNEPSWNNPVVRIVGVDKENIVPRVSGNYSQLGVVQAMVRALEKSKKSIPTYLYLLQEELRAREEGTETAILSMYCFWTGEKHLGNIPGVVETQAGFMNGKEVVKVAFDPDLVNYGAIVKQAQLLSCASQVFTDSRDQFQTASSIIGSPAVSKTGSFRQDSQPKYYLAKTHYRHVPMTQTQASRVNSAIGQGKSPDSYLSSRQQEIAQFVKEHPGRNWDSQINQDLIVGWEKVEEMMGK
ncbi:MAG: thioredoxin family protein [Bacteroidetes bacterium]|nr:thioredoxin family protein [Bacteroidota bacterium]